MENITKTGLIKLKKEEVLDIALEQSKALAEKDKEIVDIKNDFQKQLDDMKAMMLMMTSMNNNSQKDVEPTVELKCYLLGKNTFHLDKETSIKFEYCGAEETLTHAEVKSLIKFAKNKKLFSDGLLVFENKEDYDVFKVKPRRVMTDEYIIDLYTKTDSEFLSELDAITSSKTSDASMHSFVYRSAYLYKKEKLKGITHSVMEAFSAYFGKSLQDIYIDDEIL
jgi:hypothetical protein